MNNHREAENSDVELAVTLEKARAEIALLRQQLARQERENRVQVEQVLLEVETQRRLLEAVLHQLPGGVIIAEAPSGLTILVNEQAKALTGFDFAPLPPPNIEAYQEIQNFDGLRADGTIYRAEEWPLSRALRQGEVITGEEIELRRADGTRVTVAASAAPVRDRDGDIVAGVVVFQDITARKRAEKRALILQEITGALSVAATPEQVGEAIVRQGIGATGAHMGSVGLITEDGYIEIAHQIDFPAEALEQVGRVALSASTPMVDAVRSGKPTWIESLEEYRARYPHVASGVRTLTRSRAVACLPMIVNGVIIGCIGLSFLADREFDPEERDFLTALAQQCGQALERARLYRAERQARLSAEHAVERVSGLQQVTAALSKAITVDQVADVIVNKGSALAGGKLALVGLASKDGTRLEFVNNRDLPDDLLESLPVALQVSTPATDAVRMGEPVWIETVDDYLTRYPILEDAIRMTPEGQAVACLPLILGEQVFGTIGFGFRSPKPFLPEDRSLLVALAHQCAQALERARLYEVEKKARQEAEKADQLKLRFLGMISHELRTPLTSIKGFASTLLADDISFDADSQRDFITIISEEADRLAELIEQLLDLSRQHSGMLRIEPQLHTFDAVLETAMPQLKMLTPDHRLVLNIADGLPPLLVDRQRVVQVLANLVSNAVKFSPEQARITISAVRGPDGVCVSVSDEGVGIPEEDRPLIFEAFRQVERKHPGQNKGAGLGLAICKALVEAHGGHIWIEEGIDHGTTISFILPVGA